jgi:hypothetical protein
MVQERKLELVLQPMLVLGYGLVLEVVWRLQQRRQQTRQ